MRATNTAAAVTSIDGARVDGDWRVTEKREEGEGEREKRERGELKGRPSSMEEGRCLKGEMDYVRGDTGFAPSWP